MANKLLKPKRGRVENLPKLAVEDGSLIFAYDTKSSTSTVLVDVGETRYELSAATAKKADDSNALGGSSLQNIVDKIDNATGDGTAFIDLDTITNNKVKLTRANGTTVEKTVNNVSNASTADYAKVSNKIGTGTVGSSTKPVYINAGTPTAINSIPSTFVTAQQINGVNLDTLRTPGRYFANGSNTNTGKPIGVDAFALDVFQSAGGWYTQICYASNNQKKQFVRYYNSGTSSWSDWIEQNRLNTKTQSGYAPAPNAANKVYRTDANGNPGWGTLNDSSIGKLASTVTLGDGNGAMIDQNGATYRQRINIFDNATANDAVFSFQQSTDAGKTYKDLFVIRNDGTVVASTFQGALKGTADYSKNSGALGGSSLQNIVDKINNSTGDGTAFTGLDTTTNNKVKLTRANGETVEKTINNVSNASTAEYAKNASSGTAYYLKNNPSSRSTTANLAINGLGGLRTFKATRAMTQGKPAWDSHILHFDWDNTGGYDVQLALKAASDTHAQIRGMTNGAWGNWITLLDESNYTDYAAKKNAYNSASIADATIKLGRSDSSTGTTLTVNNVANASTAKLAQNSNALGGSSLSQILTAAGGGNAFTTIDTATNNVIKLTRANGGTVQKTVNNVSNASSASFASKAALASTATNASTADYAKSAAPSAGSLNYVQVLNSANINGSASYTVNELAKHHFAQGMINAATDNPLGKTGWVHVQSMAWINGSDQWASQLALDVQDGSGMYYRSSAAGGHLAGRSWNKLLDNTNYTDYAADKTAFSGVSISGRDITLTRANGGTVKITTQDSNTTYPVHEGTYDASFASSFRSESFGTAEIGWHLAAVRTNVANVSYAPQYGSGIAWARGDTHGYLYVDYYWANAYIGGGSANRLNWQKQLAFLDSTVANATSAENASHLGGKVASDYALKTDLSGNINALSAKRLPSYQSASVANSFFYRYGTAGNTSDGGAWTGFPSTTLYSEASTANGFGSALFQKKVGVLHLAAGSSAHDLVFQAGGTNGGIAYVATGRNPAYILDTLNYKDKAYTFNKLTAASTFTATSGVVIDGGSY